MRLLDCQLIGNQSSVVYGQNGAKRPRRKPVLGQGRRVVGRERHERAHDFLFEKRGCPARIYFHRRSAVGIGFSRFIRKSLYIRIAAEPVDVAHPSGLGIRADLGFLLAVLDAHDAARRRVRFPLRSVGPLQLGIAFAAAHCAARVKGKIQPYVGEVDRVIVHAHAFGNVPNAMRDKRFGPLVRHGHFNLDM